MVIKRDSNDILHFLIKNNKKEYTFDELSQGLLIPKPFLSGMLVHLMSCGYIKRREENGFRFYSLINN